MGGAKSWESGASRRKRWQNAGFPTFSFENAGKTRVSPHFRFENAGKMRIVFAWEGVHFFENAGFPTFSFENAGVPAFSSESVGFPTARLENPQFPSESRRGGAC